MVIVIIISFTLLLIVITICYTQYKLYNYKTIAKEVNDIKWDLKTIEEDLSYYNTLLDRLNGQIIEIGTILKLRK